LISERTQIYKFLIRRIHVVPRSRHSWWRWWITRLGRCL